LDADNAIPTSDQFGRTVGPVNRCRACRHMSLAEPPEQETFEGAYEDAADPVSLEEEDGQVATASRDLERIERWAQPGRLVDVGCWTGSFLVAALQRRWDAEGVEPSTWASDRARARGCAVRTATLDDAELSPGAYRLVSATDVIEHLLDPAAAIATFSAALEAGGYLFLALPDAGSALARVLGRRWWAVVPMHVQYFTRTSMAALLDRSGFDVVDVSTHPKTFSAGYFAGRFEAAAPFGGRAAPALVGRAGLASRMVTLDLRDRMAVVARKRR
jgi:SAM-dependent methyltransferase